MSRYEDGPYGLKVNQDYLEGATREGAFLSTKENLYAPGQLTPSQAYRNNYDKIKWNSTLNISQQDYYREKRDANNKKKRKDLSQG